MLPQRFSNPRLPEIVRKKKSDCKTNENDLKIAWKCTLRQSSFKNFPGRSPDPLIRGETPLILSPSRGLRRTIHAFGSQCPPPPPPPPVFRPSGSSPVIIPYWVQMIQSDTEPGRNGNIRYREKRFFFFFVFI